MTANDSTNGRGRMVIYGQDKPANLQTLIRHQVLWNFEFKEVLNAVDIARVHNWPIGESEINVHGCIGNISEMLKSQILSHNDLIRMIGDGWDIRSQGMLLMFGMANLEPSKNCIHTLQPSTTMNDEDIEVVGSESMQRTERSLLTISVASSCGE